MWKAKVFVYKVLGETFNTIFWISCIYLYCVNLLFYNTIGFILISTFRKKNLLTYLIMRWKIFQKLVVLKFCVCMKKSTSSNFCIRFEVINIYYSHNCMHHRLMSEKKIILLIQFVRPSHVFLALWLSRKYSLKLRKLFITWSYRQNMSLFINRLKCEPPL